MSLWYQGNTLFAYIKSSKFVTYKAAVLNGMYLRYLKATDSTISEEILVLSVHVIISTSVIIYYPLTLEDCSSPALLTAWPTYQLTRLWVRRRPIKTVFEIEISRLYMSHTAHVFTSKYIFCQRKVNFQHFLFLLLLCIACHNLDLGNNLFLRGFLTLTNTFCDHT